jgi:cell fate regulator YaaT (PSP1 superfamily)
MDTIVGVRFKQAGKIYDFKCNGYSLNKGDPVIIETDNGLAFGFVARPPCPAEDTNADIVRQKIHRPATRDDLSKIQSNREIEDKAFAFCRQCVQELGLPMNLFCTECAFDSGKLTFFFTADGRVDFRKLVKMLVKEFRTRIEMRQVGIRNQAKMCGGIGRCGRELCCRSFMIKFDPVSIKMAKKQGLSLNPTKISGVCGRLMCCLTFENHTDGQIKSA